MPRDQGRRAACVELAVRRSSAGVISAFARPGPESLLLAPACLDDPLADRGRALRPRRPQLLGGGGSTVSAMSMRSASAPLSFAM